MAEMTNELAKEQTLGQTFMGEELEGADGQGQITTSRGSGQLGLPYLRMSQREISRGLKRDLKQPSILTGWDPVSRGWGSEAWVG